MPEICLFRIPPSTFIHHLLFKKFFVLNFLKPAQHQGQEWSLELYRNRSELELQMLRTAVSSPNLQLYQQKMRKLTLRTVIKNNLHTFLCVYTHVRERENDLHVDSEWELLFSLFTFASALFLHSICSVALVTQLCLTLSTPMDYSVPGSSVHGILNAKILEWVPFHSPGTFWTQGLNPSLQHCRQIFYHLSHQESPYICS